MPPTNMAERKDDYRIDRASATGGLLFNDPKEGDMLRRSLQYLIQRVSGQVMAGSINFTRMSMPVHLNEPRSLLERITDDWAYASHYLPAAAASSDPVERIKLVAAFVVSGLHCIHTLGKPFNPILGSTYRTSLPDGTPCYVEQTSHHPPVTHYLIQPESGAYTLAGFSGIDGRVAWGLDTGLSSHRIGINIVQFPDGSRIFYNLPRMLVRGLASERKCEFLGPFSVFYEDHALVFDFLLDPPQPFRWSPFRARVPSDYMDGVLYRLTEEARVVGSTCFSGAFKNHPDSFFGNPDDAKDEAKEAEYTAVELRTDQEVSKSVTTAIRARDIANAKDDTFPREIISYARGTFLGYLDVDGKRMWDIRETPKKNPVPSDMEQVLASDCRHRKDVLALKKALDEENDPETRDALMNEAQMWKEKLENIQRNDRKLRAEGVVSEEAEEGMDENEGSTDVNGEINNTTGTDGAKAEIAPAGTCNAGVEEDGSKEDPQDKESVDATEAKPPPFFPQSLGAL